MTVRQNKTKNKKQKTKNNEQRTTNKEQRTKNKEQRTTNNKQRTFMVYTTKTILLIIMLFTVFIVSANDTGIKSSFPYAVLSTDTLDMGFIERGSRADGQIGITNKGEHDLLIARVRSSCGLMIPTWPDEPVKKGEEIFINFRYNTNRIGPFKRNIIIHTNAWQKTLFVYVHGEVIPN